MKWHHAACGTPPEHDMAAPLADDNEIEALKSAHDFSPRYVRKVRQRQRCETL